jgi:proteasome lid subunit RPN8/RPN11
MKTTINATQRALEAELATARECYDAAYCGEHLAKNAYHDNLRAGKNDPAELWRTRYLSHLRSVEHYAMRLVEWRLLRYKMAAFTANMKERNARHPGAAPLSLEAWRAKYTAEISSAGLTV